MDAWFGCGFTGLRKGYHAPALRIGEKHHVECHQPFESPWIAIRSQLRELFADRAESSALEQDLADYTSEKDLADLGAILDRHSDAQTGDIRRILGARV